MALLNFISNIFGNKYEKDIKNISPLVEKVNNEFSKLSEISHNKLRRETENLKDIIEKSISKKKKTLENLKSKAEEEIPPDKKEELYNEIDLLEEEIITNTNENT